MEWDELYISKLLSKLRDQTEPRIVSTVGFYESFEDLIADAKLWIYGSREVHRVFLVDIEGRYRGEEFTTITESEEGEKYYEKYREMLPKENDLDYNPEIYCD